MSCSHHALVQMVWFSCRALLQWTALSNWALVFLLVWHVWNYIKQGNCEEFVWPSRLFLHLCPPFTSPMWEDLPCSKVWEKKCREEVSGSSRHGKNCSPGVAPMIGMEVGGGMENGRKLGAGRRIAKIRKGVGWGVMGPSEMCVET